MIRALCTAHFEKKNPPFSSFLVKHRYTADQQAPTPESNFDVAKRPLYKTLVIIALNPYLSGMQNIDLPSARVCITYLASLSRNSDWTGGEGAEDSCQVDLQEMEKHQ